jgi:DNA polymerase elongation subunit (family B)
MIYTNVSSIGNNILVRGIENGRRVNSRIPYKPTLYVKENKQKTTSPSKWKSLSSVPLESLKFDNIYEAREFVKKYTNVANFDIYGQTFWQYNYISENFGHKFKYDFSDVVIATIDIEVGSDNGFPEPEHAFEPITAITLHIKNKFVPETEKGFYYVFGCGEYFGTKEDVLYYQCSDERELILRFLAVWEFHHPDIITGWNIEMFDIPYIVNRMNRLFMEDEVKRLSPWGKVNVREVNNEFGQTYQIYEIMGISVIDYIKLYRKHSKNPNQESYKLDHIASVELGENKISYAPYRNLHELYLNDYKKFIDYNIKDVTLVIKINDKTKLLELAITLAYDNKCNFDDVFSQVRMWDCITATHLYNKGIIVPPKKTAPEKAYEGGYVKEPRPGLYKWVVSFDLDGLYPHLIMMYNIGPETLVNPVSLGEEFTKWWDKVSGSISVDNLLEQSIDLSMLKKYNLTVTPNGQLFSRTKQGFFAELMESMYADRKKFKDRMILKKKELELVKKELHKRGISKQNYTKKKWA